MFQNVEGMLIVYFLVTLLLSVSIHEAMHAFAGNWLGDDTAKLEGRLTLNPLKHIDIYMTILLPFVMVLVGLPPILAAKPVPFNPMRVKYDEFGAALIALAGPFTNLALAAAGGLIYRSGLVNTNSLSNFFVIFVMTNVALFVFNMIPLPPLDGSRLLYAFAPEPVQRVMQTIEQFGLIVVFLFIFLLWPVVGPVISQINESILFFFLGISR